MKKDLIDISEIGFESNNKVGLLFRLEEFLYIHNLKQQY